MSSAKKIITVIGATGGQGGSVVKAILADKKLSTDWTVRGITRDASKESSKKLASQGVEVVEGNVDDKASLLSAFKGAYAVFAVTDYWQKMDMELEIRQGKQIADAALESGVQHFIWSSLMNVTELTKGTLTKVQHFDSKAKVEAYIRTIGLPSTFMMPGFYMSNLPGSAFRQAPPTNNYTLHMPVPSSSPVPLFATANDAGKFVKAIISQRGETLGKRVLAATKYYTFDELVEGFKKVFPETGQSATFKELGKEEYVNGLKAKGVPEFGAEELYENMKLLSQEGYYGGENLDWSHSLLTEKLTTWEEFIKTAPAFKDLK